MNDLSTQQISRLATVILVLGLLIAGVANTEAMNQQVLETYGKLPLRFEVNLGQTDSRVNYLARGRGYVLFLTPGEMVLALNHGSGAQGKAMSQKGVERPGTKTTPGATVLRMKLVGANPNPEIKGLEPLPGRSNYFIGNDPQKWRTGIPHYAKVRVEEIYSGVDLVFYGNQRLLEYDFVVAPGADPKAIRLRFEGADKLSLNDQGNLILETAGGDVIQHAPKFYQEVDGIRQTVSGQYVLQGKDRVGFQVATYDAGKPLVIDPVLVYSTHLGGSHLDFGLGIAVDGAGNAYVTGWTQSADFPGTEDSPIQDTFGGGADAFVAKLNADGSQIIYCTYLGGSSSDIGYGIAVDSEDNAYVTGETRSMYLGTNLDGVVDWDAVAFVDVFNAARTWQTRKADYTWQTPFDSGKANLIPVDENGWPTQVPFDPGDGDPMQIVHTVIPMRGPGTYKLKAEGKGEIYFWAGDGHLDPSTPYGRSVTFILPGDGPTEIDLVIHDTEWGDGIGLLFMEIHSSDPLDPVRNIDLVLPGYDSIYQTEPFHPTYTDDLAIFTNLRFMNWGKISLATDNPLQTWDDRTTPESYTQAREQGTSLKYIVQFANQLQQDAWLCIPHMADDNYVQQAAQYVHDNLDASLKVYVEYSNETWNPIFSQTPYVQDQGETLGLDPDDPEGWKAGQKYVALRSAQIWQIFEDEFGGDAQDRLVKVMATQAGSTGITEVRMSALQDPAINPMGIQPDVLAIAPYFGGPVADEIVVNGEVNTITIDEILDRARVHMQTDVTAWMADHKAIADNYDLWLITYEGGQHLVGTGNNENNDDLTEKLIAANRDPRMYDLYIEYLNILRDGGVVLHSNFSYIRMSGGFGAWGVKEDQDQSTDTAPKYKALAEWAAASPAQNLAPKARAGADAQYIDDGDQVEMITLDASASHDLDGRVVSYEWRLGGASVGTDKVLETSLGLGVHEFELLITDDDGAVSTDTVVVTLAPQTAAEVLVESDFTGSAPGLNTPWTQTSVLGPNVVFSGWETEDDGWKYEDYWIYNNDGFAGSDFDDVFAFAGDLGNQGETNLQDAIDKNHYVGFSLQPDSGNELDIRGAALEFTIDRISWDSPRRYAVMTSVDGFQDGAEIFDTGRFISQEPQSFSFTIPFDGFLLDQSIEFRIYAYEAQYGGHETSLAAFRLHGASGDFTAPMAEAGIEAFETGDFSSVNWELSGDVNWFVTSEERNSGTYSARAGSIEDDERSTLRVELVCTSSEISFYCKVSSESSFDYLNFYIDGVEQDEWSGEQDWVQVSFPVKAGTRTFEWTYSKDGSMSDGEDTAWIDDIVFPIN